MNSLGNALVRAGKTFRRRTHGRHLWFILTDPHGDPAVVVGVMLVTRRTHTDPTLVLDAGDHPFVEHPSSVHFSTACKLDVSMLVRELQDGRAQLDGDTPPELLRRIRRAILESPYTIIAIADYCRARFDAEPRR